MSKADNNKKVKALKKLGLSDAEITQVIEDDLKIDKGAKLFELPKELEEGSRKARQAGNTAGYTYKTPKVKTANNAKIEIINTLINALNTQVTIINPEREFTFSIDGKKYKIVLSCPRSQSKCTKF